MGQKFVIYQVYHDIASVIHTTKTKEDAIATARMIWAQMDRTDRRMLDIEVRQFEADREGNTSDDYTEIDWRDGYKERRTYKEWIEEMKAEWIGKKVIFEDQAYTVVDVDYNGALLIDKSARFTDTTAVGTWMVDVA